MGSRKRVVIGGLGGGGDVGLALILAHELFRVGFRTYVVSFIPYSVKGFGGERVSGALVRPVRGRNYGYRVFEDKLYRLGVPEDSVYVVCVEEPIEEVLEAMDWVARVLRPACTLHTDLGGDGLVLGYEKKLGSYDTDAVARAALAYLARRWGIPARVGIGGLGAEGGGREINVWELVADLHYLRSKGALLTVLDPDPSDAWIGHELLRYASSGMLPMYLHALEGIVGLVRIYAAYLRGKYRVEPHYRYVFVLDALKHCELSPLCVEAGKHGLRGIEGWVRREPSRELRRLYAAITPYNWRKRLSRIVRNAVRLRSGGGSDIVREVCRCAGLRVYLIIG